MNSTQLHDRRRFLKRLAFGAGFGASTSLLKAQPTHGKANGENSGEKSSKVGSIRNIRDFLKQAVLKRESVDRFLDPNAPNWAVFDAELGYTLKDIILQDGIDNSLTIANYAETGQRLMINYADRPCRINAYGNSFTQCHQVSDGETWEEYLAAHLGEPIRNFGVGGYGVYQAYRRMLRKENTAMGTPYILFNIYGLDDHYRSLDAWRHLRILDWSRQPGNENMFHSNAWAHVRFDPQTGQFLEFDSPFPTPQSLYQLCDEEYVYEHYENDIVTQMIVAQEYKIEVDTKNMQMLAEALGLAFDRKTPQSRIQAINSLYRHCALRASMEIMKKAMHFARKHNKKILVLLSYSKGNVINSCKGRTRLDQPFVDWLRENNIDFVDVLSKHVQDYKSFRISPEDYIKRYYIGHYSPAGNHFFAFAIKNAVVNWLEPKPITYRQKGETIDFKDYLTTY